jgi:holo-[acyl-carrier protein] synthase
MTHGVGIDICDNRRINSILKKYNTKFLSRVFLADEIDYCMGKVNPATYLAARFAFKEAFFKALSTSTDLSFKDIGLTGTSGKKSVYKSPQLSSFLENIPIHNIQYSISHEHNYSIAMVLLETL